MKDRHITYLVCFIAIVLTALYFGGCPDKPKTDVVLEQVKKQFAEREKILLDSIALVNGRLNNREAKINELKNQVDSLQRVKKSVPYETTKKKYQAAKDKKDTVQMLVQCDTIQQQFDEYRRLDLIEHDKTSKAFKAYDAQIADFKTQVNNTNALYQNEKNKALILESVIKDKDKEIKKLKKKARRERVIAAGLIIAGGAALLL